MMRTTASKRPCTFANAAAIQEFGARVFMSLVTRPLRNITASEPLTRVQWRCTRGPGDSVGTTATFTIAPVGERTLLELQHAGWPGTHGNFRKCNTTWGVLLHHLRDYAESGDAAPAFE